MQIFITYCYVIEKMGLYHRLFSFTRNFCNVMCGSRSKTTTTTMKQEKRGQKVCE